MAKMTIQEFQTMIFQEIDDPQNMIYLGVQKKTLNRANFLDDIYKRAINAGLEPEEATDVRELVEKALWGFGILDDLINDEEISDIRLVDENTVRVKRLGKRMGTNIKFSSRTEYEHYIQMITNKNNTNISVQNAAQVFTDKDSSDTHRLRFSLVSDLVNTNECPTLLIRKIPKKKKTLNTLLQENYLTPSQAQYLQQRWQNGHGILVCGPNGCGKTTLINAILDNTPHESSAVVIQESEELFCDNHPEMIFRKVIPSKSGSVISYELKDLAKLALMESFDIIVVGEIKGDEAADLSYASYTGSQCMTSVHSISAAEGYEKMIDYALAAQPNRTREHFAKQLKTLDTVVFVKDYQIKEILEETGYNKESGQYDFKAIEL